MRRSLCNLRWASPTRRRTLPITTTLFTNHFAGRPAVSAFNDALGYYPGAENVPGGPVGQTTPRWMTKQWDASVTVVRPQSSMASRRPVMDGTRMPL